MTRELGYERYAAQGGDWGSMISAKLGATYPEHVAGIHLNFILAPPPSDPGPEDADALERLGHWRATQSAYLQIQSTLPDSVTAAQSDSPARRGTEMPRGGHFAALEQPELLLDDVRVFLRTLR
jgi:epoxide hydrolase